MRKTRRIGMFLSILLISFIILASSYAQSNKTYINKKFNYSVIYPSDYELRHLSNIVVFVSPKKDKKFAFSENVNIMVKDFDPLTNKPEEYYSQAKNRLLKSLGEVKIIEDRKEKLNGREVQRLVYTSTDNEATFKLMQVMLINQKKVYVITYTALFDEYDNHLRQAKLIINSFKLLGK
jgi:hypothetical protein